MGIKNSSYFLLWRMPQILDCTSSVQSKKALCGHYKVVHVMNLCWLFSWMLESFSELETGVRNGIRANSRVVCFYQECILDERRCTVMTEFGYLFLPSRIVWWFILIFIRWTSNSSAHTLLACSKFIGWCICRSRCTSSCMPLSKHGWVSNIFSRVLF